MISTERIALDLQSPDSWQEALQRAVEVLRAGETVAFPTDTVYGLGADPFNESAIAALYEAKGRPEQKPLALLVSTLEDVKPLTTGIPAEAIRLMGRFWPGPLTLILPASSTLSELLRSGRSTIGVRMPDHPVALAALRAWGGPLAVTSANRSGEPDLCSAEEVETALQGCVSLILDGGRSPGGQPSTVADLTVSPPHILREGPVSRLRLDEALSEA